MSTKTVSFEKIYIYQKIIWRCESKTTSISHHLKSYTHIYLNILYVYICIHTHTHTHIYIYIYICNCSATFSAENSEIIRKQECKQTISTTSIIKFQFTEFFLLWKTSDHPASLFLSKKFNETQNLFKISIYKSNFQLDNEKQSHDHDDYCLNLDQICSSRAHDVQIFQLF